jgi:hypothetical protein
LPFSRARFLAGLLTTLCVVLLCPLACANNPPPQVFGPTRDKLAALNELGALLVKAGLPPELLPTGFEVSPEQAQQLRLQFELNPPRAGEYAPWLVADALLRSVVLEKKPVPRAELGRHIQEFKELFVLCRDGYLAEALSGTPVQCVGPVQVQDGALRSSIFEVGHFYRHDEDSQWRHVEVPSPSSASR